MRQEAFFLCLLYMVHIQCIRIDRMGLLIKILKAFSLLLFSAGHIVGHVFNLAMYSSNYNLLIPELNVASYKNEVIVHT